MTGGHNHSHAPETATGRHRQRLVIVVAITASIFVAQVIGGLASGSLALLADAGHMLTDSTGLVIALIAATLATRPATSARTYGLQRVEVLAAMVNGLLLTGIAVWVLVQAIERWNQPADISSGLMLAVAVVGAVANTVGLLILCGGKDESLNLRGAYLEVLGDLLGSLAVIAAALIITFTGYTRADSIASLLIFVMIIPRAFSLLRDVVDVLLEATPPAASTSTRSASTSSTSTVSPTSTICTPGPSPAASRCCPPTSSSTPTASPTAAPAKSSTGSATASASTSTSTTAPSSSNPKATKPTNPPTTPSDRGTGHVRSLPDGSSQQRGR